MREIEFRAWDEKNKEMIYNINLLFSNHLNDCFEEYEECGLKIMQYTGLKDRNGKKIFEGDMLHWDSHWGWYVGYENGAFRRIPLNDIQRMNWQHYPLKQEGLETWEISGNIHDNPELMGEKK